MDFNSSNLTEINNELCNKIFKLSFSCFTGKHDSKDKNIINECILTVLLYGLASLQSEMAETQIKMQWQKKRLPQKLGGHEIRNRLRFLVGIENRIKCTKKKLHLLKRLERVFFVTQQNVITGDEEIYTPLKDIFNKLLFLNAHENDAAEEDLKLLFLSAINLIYYSGLSLNSITRIVENLGAKTTTDNKEDIDNFIDLLSKNTIFLLN